MSRRGATLTDELDACPTAAPTAQVDDLEALYRAHVEAVTRFVVRLGGARADVEDLVHEIFLRADAERGRFRGASSVRTWILGIAHNFVRARRRQDAVRRFLLLTRRPELDPPAAPTPIELLEGQEALARAQALLDRLPERYRSVLILHELEELSGPEIAEILGIAPATVWVRLHRARERFRRELEQGGSR